MNSERLARLLERKIRQKPWDDYILIDKKLAWLLVEALKMAASASSRTS